VEVELLLVPYDSARRGQQMGSGPEHLLNTGLAAELERAGHTVHCRTIEAPDEGRAEIHTAFELMVGLADAIRAARAAGRFPLVLAGNCNTAVGTVSGLGVDVAPAVLWFDAHADFNTPETTTSGFLDGMGLAMLTGACWRELTGSVPGFRAVPEHSICLLGARDLDALEAERVAHSSLRVLNPEALPQTLNDTLADLGKSARAAYVHVDLDVLDSTEGRANKYAVPGGLSAATLMASVTAIGRYLCIHAAALTAYDPSYDVDGRVRATAGRVAVALLAAASQPGGA